MILPQGWESFYDGVCHRTKTLADTGIWNSDARSMLAWLGNFTLDEHRYIAAHILDRLTFRTEKMTESSYKRFLSSYFRNYVHSCLGESAENVLSWLDALRDKHNKLTKDILLCSVTKVGERGESGGHMIRILTGNLFGQKHIFPVDTMNLDALKGKIILIVDDFVGSGEQFSIFAKSSGLREAAKENNIIYAPSMSYYIGRENIIAEDYGIDFHPLEIISKREQFFSFESGAAFCGDDVNSEEDVLSCYNEMLSLNSNFNKGLWLGRNDASLCVGFQWGCPNQSLGVIWYEGQGDWHRLVRRRGSQ